ncbi:uncharacterized protein LOC131251775 [Magnolia sinica]|uniref:uncharacterized protein LOC131251775 n=1 Tax=Magnolia sinica TaxID=86752 RepID=UPI002658E937|nr:uncharacterized protein LOC131251775 [Magnolia sinica]
MEREGPKEIARTIRVVSRDEEGRKRVEKAELNAHNPDTLRYMEKKLHDKGVQRMERHPVDGFGIAHRPPKLGHGGKFTWEGPANPAENVLSAALLAIDEKDPNYVDGDDDIGRGDSDVEGAVVGEVEVAKAAEAKEGVSRIEILPPLQP